MLPNLQGDIWQGYLDHGHERRTETCSKHPASNTHSTRDPKFPRAALAISTALYHGSGDPCSTSYGIMAKRGAPNLVAKTDSDAHTTQRVLNSKELRW